MSITALPSASDAQSPPNPVGDSLLLSVLLERMDTAVRLDGADGRVVRWNDAYLRFFPEQADALRAGAEAPAGEAGLADRPDGRRYESQTHRFPDGSRLTLWTDVTAARRAEELAHRAALLEATLENTGHGIALIGADGRVITHNHKIVEMMNLPPWLIARGPSVEEVVRYQLTSGGLEMPPGSPDFGDDVDAKLAYLLAMRANQREILYERGQADGRHMEVRIVPLPEGGQVNVLTDVTARRRAEQESAHRAELLRVTLENMGQGIALFDRDLRLITYNGKALELLGLPESMARAFPTLEEITRFQVVSRQLEPPAGAPDYGDDVEGKLRYLMTWLARPKREITYTRSQADGRTLEVRVVPLPEGGQVRTYTDITDRVQAEVAVRQSREILKSVIDAIPAVITVKDRELRTLLVNRYFLETFGLRLSEVLGRTAPEILGRRFAETTEKLDRAVVETGRGMPFFEEEYTDLNGVRHDWLTTKMPLLNEACEVTHVVTVALDIHARKRAEEELRTAKERAERALADLRSTQESLIQAEKMASLAQLVAGVAHEVNTPIGVTLTAISHLGEETRRMRALFDAGRVRKADLQDFLDVAWETTRMIMTNIERATELIQSFKQVAVDQASAERRAFDLRDYVGEVLLSLQPRLRKSKVRIAADIPSDILVDGYPGAFSQVLSNLIINALVHAYDEEREGRITLTAREFEPGWVELRYADDGKGIPARIRPRIFDPFFTTKRGHGASGLGLNICYNIMSGTMKGSIAVESQEGQGTVFILRFPRQVPEDAEPPAQ